MKYNMITKYTEYIKENVNKTSHASDAIGDFLYNLEHYCTIILKNYGDFYTFSFNYNELDEDDLSNNYLNLSDYAYLDTYIQNFIEKDLKIPFYKHTNSMDKDVFYYLCTIINHNFILDEKSSIYNEYYVVQDNLKCLQLSISVIMNTVLMDIKNEIEIKNLNNLEEFCINYFKTKYWDENIYFLELLKSLNNEKLLDQYEVYKNAKNFDLL